MYKTVAIGPVFLTHHLFVLSHITPHITARSLLTALGHSSYKSGSFASSGAKLILITSEGGSITLRSPDEGGGQYGHHGSKAAINMVGKLLAGELKEKGITVSMIHVRLWSCLPHSLPGRLMAYPAYSLDS